MFDNSRWSALRKAWRGYAIAKNKCEYDNMQYYAHVIQGLQSALGLPVSSFSDIALSSSRSLNNIEITQEEQEQEQRLQHDNYESEYFEDDFNKTDRFTS